MDARDRAKLKALSNKVAVIGVGNTPFGPYYRTRDPLRNVYSLGFTAFKNALEDCGARKDDIDGVILSRIPSYSKFCGMVGLRNLRLTNVLEPGGRMSGAAFQWAMEAIACGMASMVACVYGNIGRSVRDTYGGDWGDPYNDPFGWTSPGAFIGSMWQRYMYENNIPDGALGHQAVSQRKWAQMNPNAVMQDPLTLEEYLKARYVVKPLRLYDYCLVNDGGVCFILTSAERAKDFKKPPVYCVASSQAASHGYYYQQTDFLEDACRINADQVYGTAGVGPKDIDVVQIYDNFLPTIFFSLEGYGFCGKGEAPEFVKGDRTAPGGAMPINTSGGHCSESYMQGWALHCEAVRQVRGECGPRQVPNVKLSQYICSAPIGTSHIFSGGKI